MKKIKMKHVAVGSILSLGGIALYKYNKARQIKKNTEDYILSPSLEEAPKRKYITLWKGKN